MPRIVQTIVYKFAELSDSAKEKAIDNWRESQEWFNGSEFVASLKEFCGRCGIKIKDWSLGDRSDVSIAYDPVDQHSWGLPYGTRHGEAGHMKGIRLWKWWMNGNGPFTPEEIRKAVDGSCPLTGTCTDCCLFDAIGRFLSRPDKHTDMDDLIRECIQDFESACTKDHEWTFSDEATQESIEANDPEFDENGNLI